MSVLSPFLSSFSLLKQILGCCLLLWKLVFKEVSWISTYFENGKRSHSVFFFSSRADSDLSVFSSFFGSKLLKSSRKAHLILRKLSAPTRPTQTLTPNIQFVFFLRCLSFFPYLRLPSFVPSLHPPILSDS
jgi:hypothetical protein